MTERPELTQKLEVASAVSMVELEATIRLLDGEDGPYRAHAVIKNDAQGGTNLDISVNGGPIKTEKLAFQELDLNRGWVQADFKTKVNNIDSTGQLKVTESSGTIGFLSGSGTKVSRDAAGKIELVENKSCEISIWGTNAQCSGTFTDGNGNKLGTMQSRILLDTKMKVEDITISGMNKKALGSIHMVKKTTGPETTVDIELKR